MDYINITSDFDVIDFESDNFERYDFTKAQLNPEDYEGSFNSFKEWVKENVCFDSIGDKKKVLKFDYDELIKFFSGDEYPKYIEEFKEWCDNNLSYEETHEIPMMNAMYYFPEFIDFKEKDRYKDFSATTLLYDNKLNRWAVAMTGGGMNLTPHLADAFIKLDKCIPENIARNLTFGWNAYVDKKRHENNCLKVAKGFYYEAMRNLQKVSELGINNDVIKRHHKGLLKVNL